MNIEKDIYWLGSSKKDLKGFPDTVVTKMLEGLQLLALGEKPYHSKPVRDLGKNITSVFEIRVASDGGAFRTMYTTKVKGVIGVLHCFEKKSQKTSQKDLNLTKQRYKSLMKEQNKHDSKKR